MKRIGLLLCRIGIHGDSFSNVTWRGSHNFCTRCDREWD